MAPEGNAVFNPVVARQSTIWMAQALLRSFKDIQQQIQPSKELLGCANSLQSVINRLDVALSNNQALSPLLYAGYYHFVYLLEQGDMLYCEKYWQICLAQCQLKKYLMALCSCVILISIEVY